MASKHQTHAEQSWSSGQGPWEMCLSALHPGISNLLWLGLYVVSKFEYTTLATFRVLRVGVNIFSILQLHKLSLEGGKSVVYRLNRWIDDGTVNDLIDVWLWSSCFFLLPSSAEVTCLSVHPPPCLSSWVLPTMRAMGVKGNDVLLVWADPPLKSPLQDYITDHRCICLRRQRPVSWRRSGINEGNISFWLLSLTLYGQLLSPMNKNEWLNKPVFRLYYRALALPSTLSKLAIIFRFPGKKENWIISEYSDRVLLIVS